MIVTEGVLSVPLLIKPELSELSYRKKLLGDEKTMRFCGKTVPFPREEWPAFYRDYVEADPVVGMYRLVFCRICNDFVGIISYRKNNETGCYDMKILIENNRRRTGYGMDSLRLLQKEAAANGIHSFCTAIGRDNPASAFLEKAGFVKTGETASEIIYRSDF